VNRLQSSALLKLFSASIHVQTFDSLTAQAAKCNSVSAVSFEETDAAQARFEAMEGQSRGENRRQVLAGIRTRQRERTARAGKLPPDGGIQAYGFREEVSRQAAKSTR
jgi:hypothetical protein